MKIAIKIGGSLAERDEKRVCTLLSLIFFFLILVNLSPALATITGLSHSAVSMAVKAVLAILCVLNAPILLRRFRQSMLILVMTVVLMAGINILLFNETYEYFNDNLISFLITCLPAMLYCYAVRDYKKLKDSFVRMSYAVAVLTILLFIFAFSTITSYYSNSIYSIGLGYAYLLPLMFLVQDFVENRKVIDIIGGVVLLLMIIIFGSRGPLLCIFVFGIIYLYKFLWDTKKRVMLLLVTCLFVIFVINIYDIIRPFETILQQVGIDSRSMRLILNDMFGDSGRSAYYDLVINEISKNPFAIRGINAEYLLLGNYVHNIVLELIYQFGMVFGGAAVVYIFWCAIKTIIADQTRPENGICLLLMCSSLIALMMSDSLWVDMKFWMWIVVYHCINASHRTSQHYTTKGYKLQNDQ